MRLTEADFRGDSTFAYALVEFTRFLCSFCARGDAKAPGESLRIP